MFEILLAPEAVDDLRALRANVRAAVRSALETHLRHEPEKTSRSRIKRLRGLRRPQYRLRVDDIRIFYDISGTMVEILAIVAKSEGWRVARPIRKPEMKTAPLSEVESDFPRFLREAEGEEIVITRDGRPAGVLIGFASDDDWADYQLESDPRFIRRIRKARNSLREGRGVKIEDVE